MPWKSVIGIKDRPRAQMTQMPYGKNGAGLSESVASRTCDVGVMC